MVNSNYREGTGANFSVFDLTRPGGGFEAQTFCTRSERFSHWPPRRPQIS